MHFFVSVHVSIEKERTKNDIKPSDPVISDNQKNVLIPDSAKVLRKDDLLSDSLVYLYLTFDDGPNNGTPHLLKILNEFKIPVSLFIVGKHVYGSKFQQKLFNNYKNYDWLELCNHSFTHANHQYKAFYANPDAVLADFRKCQDSLKFSNNIGRAPGYNMWSIAGDSSRFRTKTAAAQKLQEAGFQMLGWDVDWDFKHVTDHQHLLRRLIEIENIKWPMGQPSYFPRHLVILMHDQSFTKEEHCIEFRKFLETIKSMPDKYQFKKISSYPILKNQEPTVAFE